MYGDVSDSGEHGVDGSLEDAYKAPKELGIARQIKSPSALSTPMIVDRIFAQRMQFETKYKKKSAGEEKYNAEKTFVQEL